MALQIPDYLKNRTTKVTNLTSGLGASQPAHVSLANDRFTLIDDNGLPSRTFAPQIELKFVVVGAAERASRIYYEGTYDVKSDSAVAPTCYSNDALKPAEDAQQPQAETCGQCPQAVWGSKLSANGNKIPACSTRKKIAIIVPEAGSKIYLLSIPPASLKAWRNYVAHLAGNHASPQYVITSAKMENKELIFDAYDFVPPQIADAVDHLIEKEAVQIAQVVGDAPPQAALPAPSSWGDTIKGVSHAKVAALAAAETAAANVAAEQPRKRSRPPAVRANETLVEKGPIAPEIFPPKDDEEAEMLRKLEEIRAKKAAKPPLTAAAAESFIRPEPAQFGMAAAPPPPKSIEDMLAKAFEIAK